jgi:DNA-binding response OmpR family regulator/DNA-binding CsgD family transcriptional regulator
MDQYKILIADDDPNQLRIITESLIEHNPDFNLLIATNGQTAYEIAQSNKPDLFLVDWEMPKLNGIETIKMLKSNELTMGIPVIMITGMHPEVEKLKQAMDAGAIDFISKPFNKVELISRINAHLKNIGIQKKLVAQAELINEQEKEIIQKEKEILKAELLYHQKQLTINTISIIKHSELLQSFTGEINTLIPHTDDEGKKIIKSLIAKLDDKSSERNWIEFEFCFEKVHPDFYTKLVKAIPGISTREKRLCAFLKMNMSSREIAAITFQTQNAIDVAKHRIRKKAGITTDEDFTNFLIRL